MRRPPVAHGRRAGAADRRDWSPRGGPPGCFCDVCPRAIVTGYWPRRVRLTRGAGLPYCAAWLTCVSGFSCRLTLTTDGGRFLPFGNWATLAMPGLSQSTKITL